MMTVTILTVLLLVALLAVLILVLQLRMVNQEADELSEEYDNMANAAYNWHSKFMVESRIKQQASRDADYWRMMYKRSQLENTFVTRHHSTASA